MFKKPTPPALGKENVGSSRPRLGLSSLIQHSSKKKVENDIESAGASLKVLSVENTKQRISPNDSAPSNKARNGLVSSSKPSQTATRAASVTHQSGSGANEAARINENRTSTKVDSTTKTEQRNGTTSKMNEGTSHSARALTKNEAAAQKPNDVVRTRTFDDKNLFFFILLKLFLFFFSYFYCQFFKRRKNQRQTMEVSRRIVEPERPTLQIEMSKPTRRNQHHGNYQISISAVRSAVANSATFIWHVKKTQNSW